MVKLRGYSVNAGWKVKKELKKELKQRRDRKYLKKKIKVKKILGGETENDNSRTKK